MKKLLTFVVAFLLMIGFVHAEGKVKVYMFEAGGCPYCEAEETYLKGLAGYNKTFELIKKELYVDHVEWKQGKDYAIGKKVAEAFNEAGFEDASYEGTPFVVISDLYAAAAYSEDLESIIEKAYQEGDRDVVTCLANNGTDCIRANSANIDPTIGSESKSGIVIAILGGLALVGVVVYLITKKGNDMVEEVKEVEEEEVKEEKPKRVVKKTTAKTATKTTKRTTKK